MGLAKSSSPRQRGEIEITDLNRIYLEMGRSCRCSNWDAASPGWMPVRTNRLLQAANFIQAVEERQGIMISCPEEIAYRMGFIDRAAVPRN